jgi:exonuclease SbcC
MLSWLFKKRGGAGVPRAAASLQPTMQPQADKTAKHAEHVSAVWLAHLQSAQGDDAALLRVAQATPVLEIKLTAVAAIGTEEVLKQAERELRSHDRRVHRAVKQRLLGKVALRETRAKAQTLVEMAASLTGEAPVPINRLVALDHDWNRLDARLLDPAQHAEFSELRDRLNILVREHGEDLHRVQRWTAEATRALVELRCGCTEAAAHGIGNDVALCAEAAQALRDARPDVPATVALGQTLQAALQTAALVEGRLVLLAAPEEPDTDVVLAYRPMSQPTEIANSDAADPHARELKQGAPVEAQSTPHAPTVAQRWRALPPLDDGELARLLDERFEYRQRGHASARSPAKVVRIAPPSTRVPSAEQLHRLETVLRLAEGALAEGRLGELQPHLQAFDAALDAMNGIAQDEAQRIRRQVLQAENARLKAWQRWGGGLARGALVAEAGDLAQITLNASDPDCPKLDVKGHGEAIHALRMRWKELDRQGGAASRGLWLRFDAALQMAHRPVAAQQAALKAARQENLLAREALLAALEAFSERVASTGTDDMTAHWKEQLRVLERFHAAWRQLGPIEHTAPAEARGVLQQRLRANVDRIEAPLQEARRAAEAVREQLIVRAEALVLEVGRQPQSCDAIPRLRELQAAWQQHARTLPLHRAVESALWARFKTACDAVFAQRDVASSMREAELAGNLAVREALLKRLSALTGELSAAEIQRTLAEVDQAWPRAGELPPAAAGVIEARFQDARSGLVQSLNERAQERWQAQCDCLPAWLALCEERERASTGDDDLAQRWAALDALPASWEQALVQRWSRPALIGPLSGSEFDELLLKLEAAMNLPSAPEWQTARRNLKLRAMKDALEGRTSPNRGETEHADWLAAALRQSGTTEVQRGRLNALVAALGKAPSGSLVSPMTRRRTPNIDR